MSSAAGFVAVLQVELVYSLLTGSRLATHLAVCQVVGSQTTTHLAVCQVDHMQAEWSAPSTASSRGESQVGWTGWQGEGPPEVEGPHEVEGTHEVEEGPQWRPAKEGSQWREAEEGLQWRAAEEAP